MNETETPRTEAQWGKNWATAMQRSYAMRDQCNQLERELHAPIKQRDALQKIATRALITLEKYEPNYEHEEWGDEQSTSVDALANFITEVNKPAEGGEF